MDEGVSFSDLGAVSGLGSVTILAIWVIRTWPYWKMRINEAQKIKADADGSLRADLFARIRELEVTQSNDRKEFNLAMSNERKRCDEELDEIRRRLTAAEEENRGLLAMIRQNSSSTAIMIGRPDAVAESATNRDKK